MRLNYWQSIVVLGYNEGGKVDNPNDPGKRTGEGGVTQRTYNAYRRRLQKPVRDVWQITKPEILAIQRDYWNDIRGDILPSGLDLSMFDWGYHGGAYRAVKHLQEAAGIDEGGIDGLFGEYTRECVAKCNPQDLIGKLNDIRIDYLNTRPHSGSFPGWIPRVKSVNKISKYMNTGDPSDMPDLSRGDASVYVAYLQGKLRLVSDGIFGKLTEKAVIGFQADVSINPENPGRVGATTWLALSAVL